MIKLPAFRAGFTEKQSKSNGIQLEVLRLYSALGCILLHVPTTHQTPGGNNTEGIALVGERQQTETKGPSYLFVWIGVREEGGGGHCTM